MNEKLEEMPKIIKRKIKQVQLAFLKAKIFEYELTEMFNQYDIKIENLLGNGDGEEPQTEALSFVLYAEGDIKSNIREIEKIFLYQVNKSKNE